MKVIFPFAEHVPPLTRRKNYTPEPLLRCEAQPTLAHLIEPLCKLPVSEFIFVISYQDDEIRSYMDANYSEMPVSFVEQREEKGLGHTVSLASDYVSDEPILIVVGDALLDLDWVSLSQSEYSTIAVRRIIDERPYGLVELREGLVGCLIQKPQRTDLAIAGCYFIRESKMLFQCLHGLMYAKRQKNGEYQLTDALQQMIELGVEMQIQEVELANQEDTYQLKNLFDTDLKPSNSAVA
jgi:glucose-1-phosphate thymidylyltransferase